MKKTAARGQRRQPTTRRVELHPTFAAVVRAFSRNHGVSFGGQGFGSRALRLDGKIFAMLSSRGQFVVKLPRNRVAQLIDLGKAEYFDTGRDRVMKEWIAVREAPESWLELAREAYRFAKAR